MDSMKQGCACVWGGKRAVFGIGALLVFLIPMTHFSQRTDMEISYRTKVMIGGVTAYGIMTPLR